MSLVENIVSFFLITLLLLGLINLFPGALMANRRAELRLQAENVADQVLEGARAQGFSNLTMGARPVQSLVVGQTTYQARLQIGEVTGKDSQYLRSLKIQVTWTAGGRAQELRREVWVANVRS